MSQRPASCQLRRELDVFGAVMLGLGSIVGTGVFVSISIATGVAGPSVVAALGVAAVVAACNGLSSAQLAANHPVSGGTYEYGYRWLRPALGFTAGWMFVCAKSASAATAALGFAAYLVNLDTQSQPESLIPIALAAVLVLTVLALSGLRRSNAANTIIVLITLVSLAAFVLAGLPRSLESGADRLTPFFKPQSAPLRGFLQACALMFVAYTGYGRIATLGEEVNDPRRNIPRAMIVTLVVSTLLYAAVAIVSVTATGTEDFVSAGAKGAAPLEMIARRFTFPGIAWIVAVGAITAMLGVLLNLILGLSRVVMAMGRRGDLPSVFARLNRSRTTPYPAVILVALVITGLVLVGDVKTTWSLSAFTVLVYYAITNLSAIRLSTQERLYSRMISWVGLIACLFLAFWVETAIWLSGLGLLAAGLIWHFTASQFKRRTERNGVNRP